jgi:hypothetical protein
MLTREENRISDMALATAKLPQQFTINLQTGSDNSYSNTKSASDREMSVADILDSDSKILHTIM